MHWRNAQSTSILFSGDMGFLGYVVVFFISFFQCPKLYVEMKGNDYKGFSSSFNMVSDNRKALLGEITGSAAVALPFLSDRVVYVDIVLYTQTSAGCVKAEHDKCLKSKIMYDTHVR